MREQNVLTLALVTGLLAASTPAISSECCPADFTGDGHVNIDEVLGIIAEWGECPDQSEPCPMDLDQSGAVDSNDLLIVMASWGTCP